MVKIRASVSQPPSSQEEMTIVVVVVWLFLFVSNPPNTPDICEFSFLS